MELQTEIQPADWNAYVQFLVQRAWSGRGARWLQLAVPAGVGVAVGLGYTLIGAEIDFASFLVGIVTILTYTLILNAIQARRIQPDAQGYVLGARTVRLDAEGIHESTTKHRGVFYWLVVREVAVRPKHLFVMVDCNATLIIPRRAFETEAACEAFQAEIKRYREAAASEI